jgi:YHS domain-containing protein
VHAVVVIIGPEHAAGSAEHEGHTYWFCGTG